VRAPVAQVHHRAVKELEVGGALPDGLRGQQQVIGAGGRQVVVDHRVAASAGDDQCAHPNP
jgi:hypothetical protein